MNILLQCLQHEKTYNKYDINPNDPGRLVNKGWIEALQFVERHFDLTEKTIKEKGD